MWYKKLSIKFRAGATFLAFFVLAMVNFGSLLYVGSLQQDYANMINIAGRERALSQKMTREGMYIIMAGVTPQLTQELNQTRMQFAQVLHQLVDGDQQAGIRPANDEMRQQLVQLRDGAWAKLDQQLEKIIKGEISPQDIDFLGDLQQQSVEVFQQANAITAGYEQLSSEEVGALKNLQIALLLTSGILVILGWFFTQRQIISPIVRTSEGLRGIATGDGDLTVRLAGESDDEIGRLIYWFNNFVANIRQVVIPVGDTAQLVTHSSTALLQSSALTTKSMEEVAHSTVHLAQKAEEQLDLIDRVVETVMQLNQAVNQIADAAQEQANNVSFNSMQVETMKDKIDEVFSIAQVLKNSAEMSVQTAMDGSAAVENSVASMEKIRDTVVSSAERIVALGEQSKQISTIVEVINDIAEQTNLLALNAAIEAARAGEYGKGFAVVADEVRKLAERSSNATKEIATLITSIQKETESAVSTMEVGNQEVEAGVQVVRKAGMAIAALVEVVQETGTGVGAITQAVAEIKASSEKVAQATMSLAAIAQQNSAATEEMLASSEAVHQTMQNISSITQENTGAFKHVAASVEETVQTTMTNEQAIGGLAQEAASLQQLVARFKV